MYSTGDWGGDYTDLPTADAEQCDQALDDVAHHFGYEVGEYLAKLNATNEDTPLEVYQA